MKIADMHCDTVYEIWKSRKSACPQHLRGNSLHIDIAKMKKSNYLLQNFAMFTDLRKVSDPYAHVMDLIDVFYEETGENKNDISVVKSYGEIIENERQGKISALLTIEEGGCCRGDIKNLEALYNRGARMMTLTWNYPNELADPNINNINIEETGFYNARGLTGKGFLFIERMEELGMIIDVSHLSDKGFWDIAQNTKKPFAASHSNSRALCRHPRNLTDDMIKTIADRGGIIGLNFYGSFLDEAGRNSTAAKMAEHARHIINTGGSACLGLGSDFDGIGGELELQDCSQLTKLADELERQHFTSSQIEKIFYKNVMRFYKDML